MLIIKKYGLPQLFFIHRLKSANLKSELCENPYGSLVFLPPNLSKEIKTIMKKSMIIISLAVLTTMFCQNTTAQNKPLVAVLNFDVQGLDIKPDQMGNLVRLELEKLNKFEVIDRYDIKFISDQNKVNLDNCYGKICMLEIGTKLKAEKVISGSVELFGDQIVISIRMLDAGSGRMEKSVVKEFLNIPQELPLITQLTLNLLVDLPIDQTIMDKLTKKSSYESSINNPREVSLNLSGPRMGFTVFTGTNASILGSAVNKGGFGVTPVLSQFGYQFETQYLNEGKYQALVEWIPMVTGIDQGLFIPSLTLLNGLRNNVNGFEFGIGPTFAISTRSKGFIDSNNNWVKINDENKTPEGADTEYRLNSSGNPYLYTGLVLAVGKTVRSGKLNIPMNVYAVPGRQGWRFGFSFGFNAKTAKGSKNESPKLWL
jgi:TolB-like protein